MRRHIPIVPSCSFTSAAGWDGDTGVEAPGGPAAAGPSPAAGAGSIDSSMPKAVPWSPKSGCCTASWRARAQELQLDDNGLAATFPDMVGLTLGLDLDSVLGKDPSEWSFSQALGAFMD